MKSRLNTLLPLGLVAMLTLLVFSVMILLPSKASAAGENKIVQQTISEKPQNNQPKTSDKQKKQNKDQKKNQSQNQNQGKTKNQNKKPASSNQAETYEYVAQPGDSYTQMARKAIQTYGIINHVNLSGAQIIFAETNLTQAAGSPYLEVGQKVSFKVSDVQNWINESKDLSKTQLAAWNYYVQFVDFNTDHVGQNS